MPPAAGESKWPAQMVSAHRMGDQANRNHDHPMSRRIGEYIIRLVEQTRHDRQVASGASMRGALALLRCARVAAAADGRDYVLPDDVMEHAVAVLAHRLVLTGEAACAEVRQADVVQRISEQVPVPSTGRERTLL